MSKVFSKKHLLACLVVSLVLIIAGAVVFGLLGFSKDSTVRDKISVEVNGYISLLSEESRGEFLDFCEDTLEADGYSVLEVNYNSETSGFNDSVEFVIAADTDTYTDQQLSALAETLQTSINGLSDDQIENIESVVQFAPSEAAVFDSLAGDFSAIGFDFSPLGGGSYAINGVPEGIEGLQPVELVKNMLHTAMEGAADVKEEVQATLSLALARAAAVVYGQVLSAREMSDLADRLFACSAPNYTPDGKPILVTISDDELARLFLK